LNARNALCDAASGGRSVSHVAAVAYVTSATRLIWSHVIRAEHQAILFGYKRSLSPPIQYANASVSLNVTIERICCPFPNNRDDNRNDSRPIAGFGLSDMHGRR